MTKHLLAVEYFNGESVSLFAETDGDVSKEQVLDSAINSDYIISKGETCKLVSLKTDKVKTIKYVTSTKIED